MQQRYLTARGTSNLRISARQVSAADVLVASGWVARFKEKNRLALDIVGVLGTEEMRGANRVANDLSDWLMHRSYKQSGTAMTRIEARDLALMVLKWWKRPACLACGGHGHPTIENSPVIDESKICHTCEGTGRIPLDRLIKPKNLHHAKWLAGEIEMMCSGVFGKVARRLRG